MTGLRPTYFNRTTSTANFSLRESSVMAFPPYLMTTVLPANVRMYGKASTRTFTFLISLFIPNSSARGERQWGAVECADRLVPLASTPWLLQNKPAQILILDDMLEPVLHIASIDLDVLLRKLRPFKEHLLQESLHDCK